MNSREEHFSKYVLYYTFELVLQLNSPWKRCLWQTRLHWKTTTTN